MPLFLEGYKTCIKSVSYKFKSSGVDVHLMEELADVLLLQLLWGWHFSVGVWEGKEAGPTST